MPMFMDPGEMFPGAMNSSDQQFIIELLKTAREAGYRRVAVPNAGVFTIPNLAVQAGYKPSQIEASSVSMLPVILGCAISGQPLDPFEFRAEGFKEEFLKDPAAALYAQVYLRLSKNAGSAYFHNMMVDMRRRRDDHLNEIRKELSEMQQRLSGLNFKAVDMWTHMQEIADDPETIVIADSPTVRPAYERLADTQSKMTWKAPVSQTFKPETEYVELHKIFNGKKALLILREERQRGQTIGDTIFARVSEKEGYYSYLTSNRGDEATRLADGMKIKRPAESKLEPLECSMLPREYRITPDSTVQIIPITGANAQYYRKLWTHNFVGSSATWNRALLIDGYIAAVFGISKMSEDALFIWYVMKVPHKVYRLGRLCYMLAQNRCFVNTLLDPVSQEKVDKVRTAMLTKYAENKEVRGIMTLVNRQVDPQNGYKLTYEAEIRQKRNAKDALREWLGKEKSWQENRAPSTN